MAKKTFKANLEGIENPALQFISGVLNGIEKTEITQKENAVPERFKIVPEAKSRRLQLLLQPSLYTRIKAKAKEERASVNETIHNILNDALREK